MRINWEGWTQVSGGRRAVRFASSGDTPQTVLDDAARQAALLQVDEDYQAVGLHNRRADWIAAFGVEGIHPESRFGDGA